MLGQREARHTTYTHAPNISSTTTLCAHGVPVSTDSLAICLPAKADNACDHKHVCDVIWAIKHVTVKSLALVPLWPIKRTIVLRW